MSFIFLKFDIKEIEIFYGGNYTEIKTAFELLLTVLEFPTFYGNIIVDEDRIIGAIMG